MFNRTLKPIWTSGYKVREHSVCIKASIKAPLVSVIVPIYNMEEKGYLNDTLNSLAKQTLKGIEILLIDDCSTDSTLNTLISFGNNLDNITVIHSHVNGRQGAARNLGIEYARGKYLGFVDGDDAVDNDYFEKLYCLADRHDADIATAPFVLTDSILNPISEPIFQAKINQPREISQRMRQELIMSPIHIFCSIYKSTLFSECNLRFPENVFFEDNPTCFRLLCQARSLVVLDEGMSTPHYYYRQNDSSTDHRRDIVPQLIRNRIVTSNMLFDDAVNSGIYDDYRNCVNSYYMQIVLLNTFNKILMCRDQNEELINEVIESVRIRIGARIKTNQLAGCLRKKCQILAAYYLPKLYLSLLRKRSLVSKILESQEQDN